MKTRTTHKPSIEDYATIEGQADGHPIYAFGYTYVLGVSPDLQPGAVMQDGNPHPTRKFVPKKSWEISHNWCGSTPAREPKTMWNDDQPLVPVHLIDGDPETVWSSRGGTVPDRQPEWIRIDLAAESTVAAVALVCAAKSPTLLDAGHVGQGLPRALTIKVSRDARQWETVHETTSFSGEATGATVVPFAPRRAKQVWVIGNDLPRVGNWGHAFSIAAVEVRDAEGNNLALIQRGAGVQVSSTYYGYGMDRFTQDMLWPLQYDLGFKWTRVGYDMGMYLWSYVEREKGKLEIDARADAVVTEAVRNGMRVILCLDKGNWLYRKPPRKTDWRRARTREMMETYYDHQGWPTDSPELLQGYLRYVDYMVGHFKGRVAYYEICNEWQGIGIPAYARLVAATIPVIKAADPKAKIMLGSTGGFDRGAILACLGKRPDIGIRKGRLALEGLCVLTAPVNLPAEGRVVLEARSDTEAGIVLRAQDADNYVLADYAPQAGAIYFHERVKGDWGSQLASVPVTGLKPDIRLTLEARDNDLTFTVTDGVQSATTRHRIARLTGPGSVGVFHNVGPPQRIRAFRVEDPAGALVFEDRFGGKGGDAAGWRIVTPDLGGIPAKGLARRIDAIGWHPFYQADPDTSGFRQYRQQVAEFKAECAALGFRGQLAATEWTWAAPYPGAPDWCSEMQKAKYCAQLMTAHAGMDVVSLYNETFQTGRVDWDCNLLRNAFSVDPISSAQPQPAYYVLRSISTVLDGFRAHEFPVDLKGSDALECYTFRHGNGDLMLAAWIPGRAKDEVGEVSVEVRLPGAAGCAATVFDIMNGTEQSLVSQKSAGTAVLRGLRVKDYPVFVRIRAAGG